MVTLVMFVKNVLDFMRGFFLPSHGNGEETAAVPLPLRLLQFELEEAILHRVALYIKEGMWHFKCHLTPHRL